MFSGSASTALANYVGQPGRLAGPAETELARAAFLDTVGVALAATAEPAARLVHDEFEPIDGSCTVLLGGRTTAERAALLNGTAAHALDYDDVDDELIGHPSTVLVPTVLAVGERTGASGARVVEAYWRGLTVMRALASALGIGGHYAHGWHATSTLGVVGAAASASTVLDLDARQASAALGIAVSQAAGTRANFGSMTKPLHAGIAASAGVTAASLAARGLTAGRAPFDGPYGYLAQYRGLAVSPEKDPEAAVDRLRSALGDPGPAALNVKLHPCCYALNAPADAAIGLAADGLDPAAVESVHVAVPTAGRQPLLDGIARTGLEGKFSMGHAIAVCLVDGGTALKSFTDEAVGRPEIRDLAARVTADESLPVPATGGLVFQAELTVRMRTGAILRARCDAPRGHASNPAARTDVLAKYDDCVFFGTGATDHALAGRLLGLPENPTVVGLLAPIERGGDE